MFTSGERRGPHKSMHCKFCKPPGTIPFSDVQSPAQLETKTKLHLCHEAADLKVYDVYDEPGALPEEFEACICQLEGFEPCPKCAPDKKRMPEKKKVCDCPEGAKPSQNMAIKSSQSKKKKKNKDKDDEFWWEKYDREHDARAKEIWSMYMSQRKLDRKLSKNNDINSLKVSGLLRPSWYHKLSCQQSIYLEYLSTAIRLDLDETITDRTSFVLGGIGFHPRPTRKMLTKCLRYCHYNAISFLYQFWLLLQEQDPYNERNPPGREKNKKRYSWNDKILMACICYLEFPKLLREIMDRLPPLPREVLPPHIPKLKLKKNPQRKKRYDTPYDEPVWVDQIDWQEQRKIDKKNEIRNKLKRVKIPSLALVSRPSLIDARPPFLSQIEGSKSFGRRPEPKKKKVRMLRKKKKETFDSKVDVTAIAGIEASEISTTPKSDPDEICVFLRDGVSVPQSIMEMEEEEEEEEEENEIESEEEETEVGRQGMEPMPQSKVKQEEKTRMKSVSTIPSTMLEENLDVVDVDSDEDDDIPFVTPPKTQSGRTIEEPCPPPKSSPGPPASHYDLARREIGLINQELCMFGTNELSSDDEGAKIEDIISVDVASQLKQVARKLREHLGEADEEDNPVEMPKKKRRKRSKKRRRKRSKKGKEKEKKTRKSAECKKKHRKPPEIISDDPPEEFETMNPEDEEWTGVCLCKLKQQKQELEEEKRKKAKREKSNRRKSKRRKSKKRKSKRRKSKRRKSKKRKGKKGKRSKKNKESEEELAVVDPCAPPKEPEASFVLSQSDNLAGTTETEKNSSEPSEDESEEEEDGKEKEIQTPEEEPDKVYYGDVLPLLKVILKDLNEEGFISAGYEEIYDHPDIQQLIKYLHGEILTKRRKAMVMARTKRFWRILAKRGRPKPLIPSLNMSKRKLDEATWKDKKWLAALAEKKKDFYYYFVARLRDEEAKDLYLSLCQEYFCTERYINAYYAYMIPAFRESIVKGIA